jgi:DUF1365 family protein
VTLASGLYVGSVFHRRLTPRPHRFRYTLYWLLIDLDELPRLDAELNLFAHNRRALFSLHDRDHGDGTARPLRAQAEALLTESGVDLDGGVIRLLCMPRTFGHVFNPLSIYFCHAGDGALAALIYEVHNTFGERHSYVLPAGAPDGGLQSCAKAFFVSPFLPMGLHYEFRVSPPGEKIVVAIRVSDRDGVVLRAGLTAQRRELSDGALLRAGLAVPAIGIKTMAAIHWEAARLWLKGVAYLGRGHGALAANPSRARRPQS